jgi:DNA phosphorothioation-associated DGQHR protein 1
MNYFPYSVPALRLEQPLGTYYVTVLPARMLLETAYSDRLRAVATADKTGYTLEGTQREISLDRLKQIARYIKRSDSAFPNSIIIAANFRDEDGLAEDSDEFRWSIATDNTHQDVSRLVIPSNKKLAAVIDGQHRLFAFPIAGQEDKSRLDMGLICAVFLDLPKPVQAQLFATINSTQKPVDKSQTFELFGYNVADEPEDFWSPDKLAVFLTRRLNTENGSPLEGQITVSPANDATLGKLSDMTKWHVSTATVVEGILRLISSNPKSDTAELLTPKQKSRAHLKDSARKDFSVLRPFYLDSNDQVIYLIVKNYFQAVKEILWKPSSEDSFITKTVGIQALFDILRKLVPEILSSKDLSAKNLRNRLSPAATLDFSAVEFKNASGAGRKLIRDALEEKLKLSSC